MEPEIVYEDKDLIVVNKPAGMQVHPARVSGGHRGARRGSPSRDGERAPEPTLTDWLAARYPEIKSVGDDPAMRPGIVHRLDKATSGIMLVVRTQTAFEYLKHLFQNHAIKKTYLAVVSGVPKKKHGIIDAPIGIRSGTLKRSVRSAKMAKPAVTEYRVLKTFPRGDRSLLEVTPKTGRTHQIRVHLASIGHPVLGDAIYGPRKKDEDGVAARIPRLMLHALSLEFTARDGKRMKFEAEPPPEVIHT